MKNLPIVIIFAVISLAGWIGLYFIGKKAGKEQAKTEQQEALLELDHRIDSIELENRSLEDSLASSQNNYKEIVKIRTVFETIYDTIRVQETPEALVRGLNKIINTPIPPQ